MKFRGFSTRDPRRRVGPNIVRYCTGLDVLRTSRNPWYILVHEQLHGKYPFAMTARSLTTNIAVCHD